MDKESRSDPHRTAQARSDSRSAAVLPSRCRCTPSLPRYVVLTYEYNAEYVPRWCT